MILILLSPQPIPSIKVWHTALGDHHPIPLPLLYGRGFFSDFLFYPMPVNSKSVVGIKQGNSGVVIGYQADAFTHTCHEDKHWCSTRNNCWSRVYTNTGHRKSTSTGWSSTTAEGLHHHRLAARQKWNSTGHISYWTSERNLAVIDDIVLKRKTHNSQNNCNNRH